MITLLLIGIGTGNPDHVTGQAIKALNAADLILIPRKGQAKSDLADLRRQILSQVLTAPVPVAEYDVPQRADQDDYLGAVNDWHDAIAPQLKEGKTVLVTAHGNSLRALYKYLNNVSQEAILELNIPTGIPLLFELNDDLTVHDHHGHVAALTRVHQVAQGVALCIGQRAVVGIHMPLGDLDVREDAGDVVEVQMEGHGGLLGKWGHWLDGREGGLCVHLFRVGSQCPYYSRTTQYPDLLPNEYSKAAS